MVHEEGVLLLASSLLDSLPVGPAASSDIPSITLSHVITGTEPVPVCENISLWEGVVVLEGEFEIFSVIVLLSENILLWEGLLILE